VDRSRNVFNREVVVVLLVCCNAQQMIRVGMIGIEAENLSIEILCPIHLAGPMVPQSDCIGIGDRGHLSFLARCRRIQPAL
jgi:hypothetical protein